MFNCWRTTNSTLCRTNFVNSSASQKQTFYHIRRISQAETRDWTISRNFQIAIKSQNLRVHGQTSSVSSYRSLPHVVSTQHHQDVTTPFLFDLCMSYQRICSSKAFSKTHCVAKLFMKNIVFRTKAFNSFKVQTTRYMTVYI